LSLAKPCFVTLSVSELLAHTPPQRILPADQDWHLHNKGMNWHARLTGAHLYGCVCALPAAHLNTAPSISGTG
jgi:hypothetical protein